MILIDYYPIFRHLFSNIHLPGMAFYDKPEDPDKVLSI